MSYMPYMSYFLREDFRLYSSTEFFGICSSSLTPTHANSCWIICNKPPHPRKSAVHSLLHLPFQVYKTAPAFSSLVSERIPRWRYDDNLDAKIALTILMRRRSCCWR
jgi:hypothetical protein